MIYFRVFIFTTIGKCCTNAAEYNFLTYQMVDVEQTERRLRALLGGGGGIAYSLIDRSTVGESAKIFMNDFRRVFIAGESTLRLAVALVMSVMSDIDGRVTTTSTFDAGILL